jgi:hypothetical protein
MEPMRSIPRFVVAGSLAWTVTFGCDLDTSFAPRVDLEVRVDGTGIRAHGTDLGYYVELERCRMVVDTLELTTGGEMHADASLLRLLYDLAIPRAYAHPGHAAGGEVVGELVGTFVVDFRDHGRALGLATLLQAHYSGANFSFARAEPGLGVDPDDPIVGHTVDIAGTATREGEVYTFEALLDQDEGRRVVGLPLDLIVDDRTDVALGVALHVAEVTGDRSIFDEIDFATLDDDGDHHVVLEPGTEAYNRLRNSLQLHDHYEVSAS